MILKTAKEKKQIIHKHIPIRLTEDLSAQTTNQVRVA
jgi:hypothetical protein